MTVRSWPLRCAPVPGEALDSWLEAAAYKLHTPMGEVLDAVGVHEWGRAQRAPWMVLLRHHEAEDLAAATGISPPNLHAMTLAHFDRRALVINPDRQHVVHHRSWKHGPQAGSRFCPDCLNESGGRWQLSWRLGWVYACLTHHRLLADRCPRCGARPRAVPHPGTLIPTPGRCDRPSPYASGTRRTCLYPLGETETPILAPDHPALRAQQNLADTVAARVGTFGINRDGSLPALDVLADVKALGRRSLTILSADQFAQLVPNDLLHLCEKAVHGLPATGRTTMDNATAAAAVTAACQILGQPDLQRAGAQMRPLMERRRRATAGSVPRRLSFGHV
ncbi:TniQ family protein [Streptomyces phaeochromogenes]|uniref:TniQ family protein n=1 Tax=Streptomyces phaeochromogenes TaxID=1923 RepID=UPI00368A696A